MLENGTYLADRYEIIRSIGAGGMSDVYQAKDQVLGRFVAIKVLKAEFTEDMNFVTKFHAEAQAAAGLEHPNIVNIYDVGSENGMHYIVMEYIDGITLKEYIEKKNQISDKETISIAIQVGRGIEAAHKKNIIHRDIKPQNIMISKQGKVKVTDFGIAKAVNANTIHSDVMGSVHYSSPEQARNGFVDVKSDIYSLGIVMYEMVTGRVPFDGDTTVSIAIQHIQEEIETPRTYAPDIPVSLEKIILKCTQKSPDRRYSQMSELLADLKRALSQPDVDFVVMADPSADKTKIIGTEELQQIKEQTEGVTVSAPERPKVQKAEPAPVRETKTYETDEQEEEGEEGEEASGFLNPKMEKIVTIMGIVAAVIILMIVLYFVLSMVGVFKGLTLPTDSGTTIEDIINTDSEGKVTVAEPEKNETEEGDKEEEDEGGEDPLQTSNDDRVEMIDLVGKTFDEASSLLSNLGLGIYEEGSSSSEEIEEGLIMHQSVEPGTGVYKGTTIYVIISSGRGTVEVPEVVGYTDTAAIGILSDAGFGYVREYENSSTIPEGMVISQDPESGTDANPGDIVTIVVSQGVATYTVPDMKGKTLDEAKKLLEENGLVLGTVEEVFDDTAPKGTIISQDTLAGKTVFEGTEVGFTVSKGKEIVKYGFTREVVLGDRVDMKNAGYLYLYSGDISSEISRDSLTEYLNGHDGKIEGYFDESVTLLKKWSRIEAEEFPYVISASDLDVPEGTFICVWEMITDEGDFFYDFDMRTGVAFSRQN